eukprot:49836-Prorocentrum_minimum.AAC.2
MKDYKGRDRIAPSHCRDPPWQGAPVGPISPGRRGTDLRQQCEYRGRIVKSESEPSSDAMQQFYLSVVPMRLSKACERA